MSRRRTWLGAALVVGLVILGHWQLFLGADVFVEEDVVTIFNFAQQNAAGNGWRPDMAFGMSGFLGDPGLAHPWAPLALLQRLLPFGRATFTASVLLLLLVAALAQYVFIRRLVPGSDLWAALIAPLIVFGPLRHEFLFQRHWIMLCAGTPLLLLLLYDYYTRPRRTHLVLAALLSWSMLFLGGVIAFMEGFVVGAVFSVLYYAYHRPPGRSLVRRAFLFHATAIASTVALGFWVFFSVLVEVVTTDYIRTTVYSMPGLIMLTPIYRILVGLLHSGWLPASTPLALGDFGVGRFLSTASLANVSVVFPVVFAFFAFRRSRDFWEFALKWTIVILVAHEFAHHAFPPYANALFRLWPGYPLWKFQPAYHTLQLGLIALYLSRAGVDGADDGARARVMQGRVAALVLALYAAGLTVSLVAAVHADIWPNLVRRAGATLAARDAPSFVSDGARYALDRLARPHMRGYPPEALWEALALSARQIQDALGPLVRTFYAASVVVIVAIVWGRGRFGEHWRPMCAALLLADGLLLAWAIYPLNRLPLVWDQAVGAVRSRFAPTDRLYRIADPAVLPPSTPGGARIGYRLVPSLALSAVTHVMPQEPASFAFRLFNGDGVPRITSLRDISERGPIVSSPLFDVASVSHVYATSDVSSQLALSPVFAGHRLYVWRNPTAWPYAYLAERLETADGPWMQAPVRGTAYVDPAEIFTLETGPRKSELRLVSFSPGELVFDYEGAREELLVVADAWHPFWKASAGDRPLRVTRANAIFKAVRLPAGRHEVRMFFDTSPYTAGIYVSLLAWAAVLPAALWARKEANVT